MSQDPQEGERQSLLAQFPQFAKYGSKTEKAVDAVLAGSVKHCVFRPSGREVFTVVGRQGDELVDPVRRYCSCGNFYFKVIRGGDETCYHLISLAIARDTRRLEELEFSDEDYGPYLSALVLDVLDSIEKEEE